jgi:hypothetical protein
MPSEKFFVHKEDGSLVRLKGRLVRFLDEEPPTGSDKSAIRTALEVSPDAEGLVQSDVGTDPNQLVLHQHLGDISYQSADSVAMGTAEVETLEVTDKVDGNLTVNGADPVLTVQDTETASGSANATLRLAESGAAGALGSYWDIKANGGKLEFNDEWNEGAGTGTRLVISDGGSVGIGTASPSAGAVGGKVVHVQTSGETASVRVDRTDAAVSGTLSITCGSSTNGLYSTGTKALGLSTNGTQRWLIDGSNGNLISQGGSAIDFGSAATSAGQGTGTTGSVSNSVLSDYEYGSWTPSFATSGADFATINTEVVAAQYCKVGRVVHCQAYLRTDNVDATGASGTVVVDGLPFVSDTTADNFSTLNVGYSASWVNAPAAGYLQPNAAYVRLTRYSTTGASTITPSDLTAGASADKNTLIFSLSYIAST